MIQASYFHNPGSKNPLSSQNNHVPRPKPGLSSIPKREIITSPPSAHTKNPSRIPISKPNLPPPTPKIISSSKPVVSKLQKHVRFVSTNSQRKQPNQGDIRRFASPSSHIPSNIGRFASPSSHIPSNIGRFASPSSHIPSNIGRFASPPPNFPSKSAPSRRLSSSQKSRRIHSPISSSPLKLIKESKNASTSPFLRKIAPVKIIVVTQGTQTDAEDAEEKARKEQEEKTFQEIAAEFAVINVQKAVKLENLQREINVLESVQIKLNKQEEERQKDIQYIKFICGILGISLKNFRSKKS